MSEQTLTDHARGNAERHLLLAVDASENSKRAATYVADFFGKDQDVYVTIFSIIPEPSEDYFATDEERTRWVGKKQGEMNDILAGYKDILLSAGFKENQIDVRLIVRQCESIGDAIIEEQAKLLSRIVIVGRRGISHNEEFVFGSTSSRILHHAKNCAVMVIE